jgi:hypothetical protein
LLCCRPANFLGCGGAVVPSPSLAVDSSMIPQTTHMRALAGGVMSRPTREMAVGFCPSLSPPPSHSHYTSPEGRIRQFRTLHSPVVVLFYASFVHSARTGHPRSPSSSQHTLSCSLAELPSQIVMSVPEPGKHRLRVCIVDVIVQLPDGRSGV